MKINERGHVVNSNGETTEPMRSQFWVGDSVHRVAFDFLKLDDGTYAIHSFYGNIEDQKAEDFLYEVVPADEAVVTASTMVKDAMDFLVAEGAKNLDSEYLDFEKAVIRSIS